MIPKEDDFHLLWASLPVRGRMGPVVTEEVPGYGSNSGFVLSQIGHYLSSSHNWAEHD